MVAYSLKVENKKHSVAYSSENLSACRSNWFWTHGSDVAGRWKYTTENAGPENAGPN